MQKAEQEPKAEESITHWKFEAERLDGEKKTELLVKIRDLK